MTPIIESFADNSNERPREDGRGRVVVDTYEVYLQSQTQHERE
jgi:hypothetical protein